ncbi:MAG TPA: family 1 glycosylhydrolase [Enhygromyxa sp.]|nr:family 1 glycosylhydrolase [Enhygromyxa sp.]
MWGGVECTVNRVRRRYFDQLRRTGHDRRIDDLDAIAGLGVRALRFPILWERTAPKRPDEHDWSWSDVRLARLRELGITPIVGLLHHGSGPAYTDLLDPEFPARLANYAGAVARRYPWVELYTPINEPLTTARFCGLYGHWYPHQRSDAAFCRALIHQCRAVQLAMRAIRAVNPRAQLLQTEDLGLTLSTPGLIEQADFENARHLLGYDLLCGRVDRGHPLFRYLRRAGVAEAELDAIRDAPPPDLLGANHYITSVRLLDQRLEHYPSRMIGGNGRRSYADVEAVRASAEGFIEPVVLLRRLWVRYQIPLAITEVHLACVDVAEQIRWVHELWDSARRGLELGIDIRAVTAWSLLGAYDWHCLVTREHGCYEPGAFDVGDGTLRATALAGFLRELGSGRDLDHPALEQPGWWRRAERLLYPPISCYPLVRCASVGTVRRPGAEMV